MAEARADTLQTVELADGVEIQLRVAGLAVRSMAYLIDLTIRIGIDIVMAVCAHWLLLDLIGERAPQDSVLIALDDLKDRALAWGTDQLRVAAELVAGLPWFPGQVAMDHSTAPMTTDEFDSRYNALSDAEKDLLTVLAEGVETQAQHDALITAGCDLLQGYLLGRPTAPDARSLEDSLSLPGAGA